MTLVRSTFVHSASARPASARSAEQARPAERARPALRFAGLLAAALAIPSLVTAPSQASNPHDAPDSVTRSTTTDRNDTRGPLDIASVSDRVAAFGDRHAHVAFTVRTHQPLDTRELNRQHRNITIELGTSSERGASHNIAVWARTGRLRATLISNATREPVARLAVQQVGDRAVRIRGPRRLIGARRYFVVSRYEKRSTAPCGRAGNVVITCGDSVPDRGWVRMDRPAWPRNT